ncbi:GGDEF domain-containing protein [Cryobacterium sp. GrIS_2_6]|uniref:GGDEF domain-containing protein n=1 Tax=Cryobacterium sp. GrIS_2_6 TaxID=3162785 RepID=UPI002E05AF07|nr:diguanylate cyclase (GGDEF)-like protein [Cryobacterium psychrotolerans]
MDEVVYYCAGLDVHRDTVVGVVRRPGGRGKRSVETRTFVRLERNGGMVCVMYLDIDDFKIINDTLGHGGGDDILIELGRRLASVLRPTDTVARFGGDEFVILCENFGGVGDAEQLAARVVAATTKPWDVQGWFMPVHVSIGFAVTDSATTEPAALLDDADTAMYMAKKVPGSMWV